MFAALFTLFQGLMGEFVIEDVRRDVRRCGENVAAVRRLPVAPAWPRAEISCIYKQYWLQMKRWVRQSSQVDESIEAARQSSKVCEN
jgi:hypothetical protein